MKKKNKLKKGAGVSTKTAAASKVVANARLVAAIRASDSAMKQAQSLLVTMARIAQQEDLTRPEVVASIMEARGIEKSSAESQYSRMKKLLTDPQALADLESGVITLRAAREGTKTQQKSPNPETKRKNAEKKFAKAVGTIVDMAKETGMDDESVIRAIKAALKKARKGGK